MTKTSKNGSGNLIKILSMRINLFLWVILVAACSSSPHPVRTTENEGIISARARNELAQENPEGLVRVGEGFEKSGNLQGALNLYGQAISAAPHLFSAKIAYARVTGKLGDYDRAQGMLDAVLEEDATNFGARYEKAGLYIARQKYQMAEDILSGHSLATAVVDHPYIFRLAKLKLLDGDNNKGRELLGLAIERTAYNSQYIQNLAYSFALAGDFKTAIALVQQSLDQPAGKESGRDALALIYAMSGQISQALEFHIGVLNQSEMSNRRLFYRALGFLNQREMLEAVFFQRLPPDIYERMK